ncbi:transporter associated domain-containing protein [Amaricoccus sp.]|uniref:transporter associated domain-containing protein n=1 Tax=Amaricoccus sp. TaxID=1872485 RepID=UPI001B7B6229|nr:hemolysin family protein [Amaricoccus sp.]MBP7002516.1 HlyC/CorC family transporter [Amaricoccus sp.]
MGEHDSGAAASTAGPDEAETDSSARPSFLARLFRRDGAEGQSEDGDDDAEPAAAHPGSSEMIGNVRRIRRMRVEDVSVPRTEVIAVPDDVGLDGLVAAFKSSTMTRLPVYSGSLDRPKGLVHLKDLALRYGFGEGDGGFDLEGLLRPLLYVPPSMPIGVLLQKMQAARIHMALIIDEYGGVDGLVTIEDILEQIVGDIGDEHDEDEAALWSQEGEGVYVAPARMELDDFAKETGVRLAAPELAEEVDTLGGLVSRLAGRVPARGEIVVHPDGHEFEVLDADARRIKRLRLRLGRATPGAAEAAE